MDLDALLQNFGEDTPSGEDLEYDPEFTELEIAAQFGEERQAGDQILAAEEPDYKEVSAKALAILQRSHDLRAAIYLAEARLRLGGLPDFADATTYIRRCLEDHWDSCHPQLDAEDDNDPTMRVNAVLALADKDRVLRGLRRAPLTASRTFGAFSLRDIAVAEGEATPGADMERAPDAGTVSAAFQDTDEDMLRAVAHAARTALEDVKAINARFDAETPGQGPELDPLIKVLRQIDKRLTSVLGEPEAATDDDGATADEAPPDDGGRAAPAAAPAMAAGGGAINSPNDVRNAIDRIIAYYERNEPSSPVPVLLQRAKKMVGADFLEIVRDMAPGGIDNVHLIAGIEDD